MIYQRHIKRALLLSLAVGLTLSAWFYARAGAQQQQQQETPTSRPRRTGEQETPKTTQTPSKDDDVTLQEDEVVRVETDLTNILFTAVDKQKRFVTTLKQEDIRVTEDGLPQEIFTFQQQVDLPLSLAILIDTSASQERTLPDQKDAARGFIDAVIRENKDEVAVVSFTGEATLEQGLTGNVARIRRAIDKLQFVPPSGYIGGGVVVGTPPISDQNQRLAGNTAVWDAIWITSDEVLTEASDKTRRAIILISDGVDSISQKKLDDAIERAIKSDVLVFAIGIGDSFMYQGVDERALRKVAERTGGHAYFPEDEQDLRKAFAQIQRELRSQYLVAYRSTNRNKDGSFRRVQVEIMNPELRKQNLRLTHRQGYFPKTAKK